MEPGWLRWAKELQAIAQIGLAYPSGSHFDRERYERIREIAAEMMASGGRMDKATLLGLFEREGGTPPRRSTCAAWSSWAARSCW
jgi:hypothetical protein